MRTHKLFWDKTEGLKRRALMANVGKRLLRQASSPQCPLLAPGLLQNINVPCLLGHQLLHARFSLSGTRIYLVSGVSSKGTPVRNAPLTETLLSINGGYSPTCYVCNRSSRKGNDMQLVPSLRELPLLSCRTAARRPLWHALVTFGVIGFQEGGRSDPYRIRPDG